MRKFHKAVEIQRDFLQAKSKKSAYPTFVWIEAPSHMNFPPDNQAMRKLYNSAVNAVAQRYEDTYSLQLKKVWDPHASSLFMAEDLRYTAEGLRTYWEAVDKTVRYVDTLLLKKPVKKQNPATEAPAQHPINERNRAIGPSWEFRNKLHKEFGTSQQNVDRFHWRSDKYDHLHHKHSRSHRSRSQSQSRSSDHNHEHFKPRRHSHNDHR